MSARRFLTVTVVLLGTVLAARSSKAQQLTTLYNFCSQGGQGVCTDGGNPQGYPIQGSDGNFYGITTGGGEYQEGSVYKMTPSGALTTLYSFCPGGGNCTDGAEPWSGVIQGSDGNFYGTTVGGGNVRSFDTCGEGGQLPAGFTCGTIFKLTPSGELTTLYSFCPVVVNNDCPDGASPYGGLVLASDGNFYGTAAYGGADADGPGAIYKLFAEPSGGCPSGTNQGNGYCEEVIYSFCLQGGEPCGWEPVAPLIQGSDGNLYGTTEYTLGEEGGATVFKVTTGGSLTTLATFGTDGATAGSYPTSRLVQASNGIFYGTTTFGGPISGGPIGTVYSITSSGVLTTVYPFCSLPNCADGYDASRGLIQGSDGNLYGMTYYGGNSVPCSPEYGGCGTIFKLTLGGTLTVLHVFCSEGAAPNCTDGESPVAALVQASNFNFYSVAGGGTNGAGIFFALNALPIASVSPTGLTFSSQDEGTTSASQPVTLSNTGQEALTVSIAAPSGDFAQTNNCGGSVAIGANCTINVTFSPTQTGTRTGTLTITDNTGGVTGSVQTVSLTGTGANPAATLSTTSLAFGDQAIDTTSNVKKVTLTSSGTTSLTYISMTITGANAADFHETNTCTTGTLKVNAKCTISVTFAPTLLATESATLQVTDNAVSSPQAVALTGTGEAQATLTPGSYTFPKTKVGETSAAHKFTLKNNLPTTLTGISYATAAPFAVSTTTCGTTLDSKKSCTISVTFSPTETGTATGTLTVSDSADDNPQRSSLTGTGD